MKKYKIKVNGKLYEVELEAIEETSEKISEPVKEEKIVANVNSNGNKILAPIGGKVLEIKVNVGDTIKKGQTVAIIEAMKLENEVPSEFDGVVKQIVVNKGAIVENQQVLIILG